MNFSFNRNLLANLIGRSWTPLLSIFFLPITVRLMGIEAYGLVGFYVTMINIINVFELGLGPTLNRQLAKIISTNSSNADLRDLSRTFELILLSIALIVGLFFFFAAPFISTHWIQEQDLSHETVLNCIQLMGFAIAFQFPQSFYNNGLMAMHKQIHANVFLMLYGTFRVIGSVGVLYYISSSPESFFVWHLIVSFSGCAILYGIFWNFLPKSSKSASFNSIFIKDNWSYSIIIFGNAVVGVILTQLSRVLLSKTLTLTMFSYYTIATTLATVLGIIVVPISSLVFSQYVHLKESNAIDELKILYHRTSQNLALLMFPLCAVLIFYSKSLILVWMNDAVIAEQTYLIANLFIIGGMINAMNTLPINATIAFGWPKMIFWSNLIQAALTIPVIYFLVRWYQGIGAGWSWIILNTLYLFIAVPFFFRRYFISEMRNWYIKDIAIPLLVCFSVAGISKLMYPDLVDPLYVLLWIVSVWFLTVFISILFLPHVKSEVSKKIFNRS